MDDATLVAISSLGGVFLGVVGSVVTTWMTKRYEDRRHLRELALNLGLEDFKTRVAEAVRVAPQKGTRVPPLDDFVVHMLCLADLINRKGTRADNLAELLGEVRELAQRGGAFYEQGDPLVPRKSPPS